MAKKDERERLGDLMAFISHDREELVEELLSSADLDTLRHVVRKGTPDNSLRAYISDLTYLEAWALAATGRPLPWPAPEPLVLKFIAHHLYDAAEKARNPDHGMPENVEEELKGRGLLRAKGPHAPSTVRRRLASWTSLHRFRDLEEPFGNPVVRQAIKKAAAAADRSPERKSRKSIGRELLDELLITCEDGSPRSLRDRALLLFAFASGGRRRSEIAALRVEDIEEQEPVPADPSASDGPLLRHYRIRLRRTKTTSVEKGATIPLIGLAADALAEWLESESIASGYAFRALDRWDNIAEKPISAAGINHMLKRRLADLGYDSNDYSAHGLRAGFLTEAAKAGVSLPEAMQLSQHRSVQQAARYYNDAEIALGKAARLIS